MTTDIAIRYCDEYLARHISDIDKEFLKKAKEALQRESCEKTQMVDKSNFNQEQYRADLQSAYDCGKASVAPCEDVISRQAVNILVDELARAISDERCCMPRGRSTGAIMQDILDLPPVNPQETVSEFADRCRECGKMKRCKDCKHFEYDSVANWDGIPIIVAHEICSRWGEGCKTSENGYCFLFEPKEEGIKHG